MKQGPYTNPSVSSLSLYQSKQSDSPDGKISQAMLFPLVARHFMDGKRLSLFCLMRQKYFWSYFAFNQSYLAKGKIAPVVLLPHETK